MTTINTMVKRCMGLIDTTDVSDWESDFLQTIAERTRDGDDTSRLTERQIDVLDRIFRKHFSG